MNPDNDGQTNPTSEDDSIPCGTCKNICSDSAMECDGCKMWFHIDCGGVTRKDYNYYGNNKLCKRGFMWFCIICREKLKSFNFSANSVSDNNLNNDIKEEVKTIKQGLKNLQDTFSSKFDKLESNFSSKSYAEAVANNIKENIDNNQVISSINENLNSMKKNIENSFNQEKEDKEKARKSKNVCIFNVPELDSDDRKAQKSADISKLKQLLDDKVKLEQADVKAVFRAGEYHAGENPRPIILCLNDMDKRAKLLKLRNLSLTESSKEWRIYINPDRTKHEQKTHKALRQELKHRREEGEENLIIRGGKIVTKPPFPSDPQVPWGE